MNRNNPAPQPPPSSNYPRSPGGGPPIAKKQRGGSTPGSIRDRSRTRSRGRPPPPVPPPASQQQQPTPSPASLAMDDGIARRRAELRRLKKKADETRAAVTDSKGDTKAGGPPPKPTGSGPPIPTRAEEQRAVVPGTKATRVPPPAIATNPSHDSNDPNVNDATAVNETVVSGATSNPNLPPQTPLVGAIPPTPAVGRRLEFPSGKKTVAGSAFPNSNNNSNSVSSNNNSVSISTTTTTTTKAGPPRAAPPPRRARSKSPAIRRKGSTGALSSSHESAAHPRAMATTKRNRAKSAPPRRPPGPPPGGPPKPAAASKPSRNRRPAPVTASSLLRSKAKTGKDPTSKSEESNGSSEEDAKTKTKTLATTDVAAVVAAAGVEPPPTLDTSNKSSSGSGRSSSSSSSIIKSRSKSLDDETKTKSESELESESDPSVAAAKTGPPPTDSAIGVGSLDTTEMAPPPLMAETPLPAKGKPKPSDGSGSKTPPSSGSSARRQKLQLMREQAAAASEFKPSRTEPPSSVAIGGRSSGMDLSMGLSSGSPATEAFARAIGASTSLTKLGPTPTETLAASDGPPPSTSAAPSMRSAAQSRLEDAYQKSEREKTAALLKIKQLEDQLSQKAKEDIQRAKTESVKSKTRSSNDLQQLLSIAETQGPQAALQWAKTSLQDGPLSPSRLASQRGFHTGMGVNQPMTPRRKGSSLADSSPLRRARFSGRHLTPHPADTADDPHGNETPEQTERRLLRSFREAANYVPFEFSSDLATYTVRRPYGIPTNPGLFEHCQPPLSPQQQQQGLDPGTVYAKRAHVSDQTTLEVAAVVKADQTPVLIFGDAGIRYRTNPNGEWVHYENVDALDRPLGHVTYIDSAANEKEYSLDEILEEALLVREQYCGTVTSTALGLEGRPPLPEVRTAAPTQQQPPNLRKPPSKDTGGGTDAAQKDGKPASQQQPPRQQQQTQQRQPEKDPASSSSDVLVVFVGMLVSFAFRLVWGVVVGTPLRILRTAVVLTAACFLLQAVHFYLADDYNAWALREMTRSTVSLTAGDLAYHSNRQPGIM